MKRWLQFGFNIILLLALAGGCTKNQQIDLRPNLNVANDLILTNRPFLYTFRMLARAVSDSGLQANRQTTIDGAYVTLNAARNIYTFSYSGGYCTDSVVRHGTFKATVNSVFSQKGTVILLDYPAFYEDGHFIAAHDSAVCEGPVDGKTTYSRTLRDVVIYKDSARSIAFTADYTMELEPGMTVGGKVQPAVTCSGTGSGLSSDGFSFTCEMQEPLVAYASCPWIAFGIIGFTVPGATVTAGTIEFMGKDECNDRIDYNFGGTVMRTWIKEQYLRY